MVAQNFRRLLVICFGCLLLQACVAPPKRLLDENARVVPEGREALVVVAQGEIRTNIVVSNVSAGMGGAGAIGALVGAIVDTTVNQNRTDAAESSVKPLRDALVGYNFDQRVLDAADETLKKIPWLDVKKIVFPKDDSKDKVLAALDQSSSPQLIVVHYVYVDAANQHGNLIETSDKGTLLYKEPTGNWVFVDSVNVAAK